MAWFGEGLPSLSNLKGQITNFTKEVLSDSLVEDTGKFIQIQIVAYLQYEVMLSCYMSK